MSYAVFPWTLPYLMSCISILSILVYIHVLFLYALSLSTLIFCYHSTVEEIAYISFFQVQLFFWILLLPVTLHLTAFFPLLLFSHYVMLFFSILSSGPLQQWLFSGFPLHLCNLSSLFPPFLFLLSSFSSFSLFIHHMSQFWRGPLRASSLMNVSATWIFHAPCSCLLNDSANSKAHWLKFHFILLDVFLFCLFAQDGVCLSA